MDFNSFLMQLLYPEKMQAWREQASQRYNKNSWNDAQPYSLHQLFGHDTSPWSNLPSFWDRQANYEMNGPRDEPSMKVDRIESMGRSGMI